MNRNEARNFIRRHLSEAAILTLGSGVLTACSGDKVENTSTQTANEGVGNTPAAVSSGHNNHPTTQPAETATAVPEHTPAPNVADFKCSPNMQPFEFITGVYKDGETVEQAIEYGLDHGNQQEWAAKGLTRNAIEQAVLSKEAPIYAGDLTQNITTKSGTSFMVGGKKVTLGSRVDVADHGVEVIIDC